MAAVMTFIVYIALAWILSIGACWCIAFNFGASAQRRRMLAEMTKSMSVEEQRMRRLAKELNGLRPDLAARINAAAPRRRPGDRPS